MSGDGGARREGRRRGPLRTAWLVLRNTVLLFLALELLSRGAEAAWRAFSGRPDPVASRSFGEEVHPFFQNTNAPGPGVDAGPDLAGWIVDAPRGEGSCRVMFLGGSTMAFDLPRLVGEELGRRGVPARTYNLAAAWHASLHSLYKFWTYHDVIRPHLVVVLHNANDFYRGFTPPHMALATYRADYSHHLGALHPYWRVRPSAFDGRPVFAARAPGQEAASLRAALGGLLRSSSLLGNAGRVARRLILPEAKVVHMAPEVYLRSLPAFQRNLGNLALGCRAKEVPLLLLTMPHSVAGPGRFLLVPGRFFTNDGRESLAPEEFEAGMARFNQAVRDLGRDAGAPVLDLEALVTDPALFDDEVHLAAAGKRLEAQAMADFIVARGLLAGCGAAATP